MKKVIRIKQGSEFKVLKDDVKIIEDDLFYSQYESAKYYVSDIIKANNKETIGIFDSDKEYLNNIISFSGDRGSGKTTAMKTFSYALCKNTKSDFFKNEIGNVNFCLVKAIDPSNFESIHNVLSILVSRMFKEFEKMYQEDVDAMNGDLRYSLLDNFQKVYRNLAALYNVKKYEDNEYEYEGDVQKLSNIASNTRLKVHLYNLVEEYLKLKKSDFLVVMIDDLDLNIRDAYRIAEEVRKYLSIPNIIIIMAIRVEQLSYCVKKEFLKIFNPLMSKSNKYEGEVVDMTNKYLNKLIPEYRRIAMPNLKIISNNNQDLITIEYEYSNQNMTNDLSSSDSTIEMTILKNIFELTGIVFLHNENKTHAIVPATLRELVTLYDYLGRMKSHQYAENISILKDYIMNVWCKNNLNEYFIPIVKDWDDKAPKDKNRYLCEQIQVLTQLFVDEKYEEYPFMNPRTIVYKLNMQSNTERYRRNMLEDYSFSLGETFSALTKIETITKNNHVDTFVNCIFMLYSILLNETKYTAENEREANILQPNTLNSIIAGSIWGDDLLNILPEKTSSVNDDKNFDSRVKFNYDAYKLFNKFFKESLNIANNLTYFNNNALKNIKNSNKKSLLYLTSVVSSFETKKNSPIWNQTFISNNNSLRVNAEFRFDRIFMLFIDPLFYLEKYNLESEFADITYLEDLKEDVSDTFGIQHEGCQLLLLNPELSRSVLQLCIKRKPNFRIKVGGGESEVYKTLFTFINTCMEKSLQCFTNKSFIFDKDEATINGLASTILDFARYAISKDKKEVQLNKIKEVQLNKIKKVQINKIKKESIIAGYLKGCYRKLYNYLETEELQPGVKENIQERIQTALSSCNQYEASERVSLEMIVEYNKIYDEITR